MRFNNFEEREKVVYKCYTGARLFWKKNWIYIIQFKIDYVENWIKYFKSIDIEWVHTKFNLVIRIKFNLKILLNLCFKVGQRTEPVVQKYRKTETKLRKIKVKICHEEFEKNEKAIQEAITLGKRWKAPDSVTNSGSHRQPFNCSI